MTEKPIPVRIFGVPVACGDTVADQWRQIADWTRRQLLRQFGGQVTVEYYDLFSPETDRFPEVLALVRGGKGKVPLVYVGDELLSSGGKVSVLAIRRKVESLLPERGRTPDGD
jgi:disulfide oxidoreductase YuzD